MNRTSANLFILSPLNKKSRLTHKKYFAGGRADKNYLIILPKIAQKSNDFKSHWLQENNGSPENLVEK